VYQLLPDLDVRFHGAALRTNSQGWREQEIRFAKEPDTVRVVGIGDSVMFGWGVEESERYMDLLEHNLNETYPARRWQSVTLAAPGYNLVMEVEALKEFGLQYSPDLIVVGFSSNDFCLPNFVVPRRSVWTLDSFLRLYFARSRSTAPQLVQRLNVLLKASPLPVPVKDRRGVDFFATYCSPENVPREHRELVGLASFLRSLEELVRIARNRQIPVVLLHHGIGQGYVALGVLDDRIPAEVTRALAAATQLEGLVTVDLTSSFQRLLEGKVEARALLLNRADPHPSTLGHQLISKLLLERLAELGVIQEVFEGVGRK